MRRLGGIGLALLVAIAACGGGSPAPRSTTTTASTPPPVGEEPATADTTTSTAAAPPTTTSAAATSTSTTAAAPSSAPLPQKPGRVVVLDPGHNGANGAHPGEINRKVDAGGFQKECNTTGTAEGRFTESAFAFSLARLVASHLTAAGVKVVLTRQGDDGIGPCIDARGKLALSSGASVLLSIHADGAEASEHGFHVIHPAPRSGYVEANAGPSAAFARTVRDRLVAAGLATSTYAGRDGLVERGDLGTLNWARVTTAMVECGNMHNPADLALLRDQQPRLAAALADAVLAAL